MYEHFGGLGTASCTFWTLLHFRPNCCLSDLPNSCTWIPGKMRLCHGSSGLVFPAASRPQCPTAFGGPGLSTIVHGLGLWLGWCFFQVCLNAQHPVIWNDGDLEWAEVLNPVLWWSSLEWKVVKRCLCCTAAPLVLNTHQPIRNTRERGDLSLDLLVSKVKMVSFHWMAYRLVCTLP